MIGFITVVVFTWFGTLIGMVVQSELNVLRQLPPATARDLRRARRANRADITPALRKDGAR